MVLNVADQFNPKTMDKVDRLMDVLEQMTSHPMLRDSFAMYGGTAINLFMLDIPRLSVDIDATYLGSADREEMLKAKPGIERAIGEIAQALGYSCIPGKLEHAGRTFHFQFRGDLGPDNIKIDFTYLNRTPLMPVEKRSTSARTGLLVPILSGAELVGGKAKAYFSRVKVRDLFDIVNLHSMLNDIEEMDLKEHFHKIILYKASLSAAFPFGFKEREKRFSNKHEEFETELRPMLRNGDELSGVETLMESAAVFVEKWVLPWNVKEQEYLDYLTYADFRPELLFANEEITANALSSPESAWKIANLRRLK